ncbi:MAG: sigma-54-dependent Fis family transcriptional regulator [Spirochaeta sp.]|nr:sigma-54-dependent Fis family transcriptional regulator [Spirochaeta sp.]RPG09815.1 MAG: sigma-54-dependent Fis family transcriptional regulator [Proteobacteria bacterium TMED72]
MQSIRSLLWIGRSENLARTGISEAPELDITWLSTTEEAFALPANSYDGIVLDEKEVEPLVASVYQLLRRPHCPPIFAVLPSSSPPDAMAKLLNAGAREILIHDENAAGPRLLEELLNRLPGSTHPLESTSHGSASKSERLSKSAQITPSEAMQELEKLITRAANAMATVLLQGETGTGKEVAARKIHQAGPRHDKPFIALNCAAFPESLLESELFGHRRGAFTGADRDKPGHFAMAQGGTLFLDEVAEMSPALQAKLLRVLQEKEILPVGASRPQSIDARVIAATNESLADRVTQGEFRQDLYYRLAVFPIDIPPLRKRTADIVPLANHFLQSYGTREHKEECRFSKAAARLLQSYRWPGNVRELENEIQRALTLAEPGEIIGPRLLSSRIVGLLEPVRHIPPGQETLRDNLESIEAWLIRRALSHQGGRKAATARKLGITREGLYKKMKRLGVE